MVKHNVKVVIRTRPTANFASKNLHIDTTSNVSLPLHLPSLPLHESYFHPLDCILHAGCGVW